MSELVIYTDGACSKNPGPGGYAAIVLQNGKVLKEITGGDPETTNNRMELMAPIRALQWCCEAKLNTMVVFTDSMYLRDGITSWIKNWQKNNWVNAKGEPVKNKDLWVVLLELDGKLKINWQWVKAHDQDEFNNKVDSLAKHAIIKQMMGEL